MVIAVEGYVSVLDSVPKCMHAKRVEISLLCFPNLLLVTFLVWGKSEIIFQISATDCFVVMDKSSNLFDFRFFYL
jgi:hypothetical protein